MEPWQILELKHVIMQQLLDELLAEAATIDVAKYTRIRFVLEFNYDPVRGTLTDAGIEPRKRRELKK